MKEGPDIAHVAALIGDPARANILTALMSGKALTAAELACEAGVTPATASQHLARLQDGGLIQSSKQGRHKYITLASDEVAQVLEILMSFSANAGFTRIRTGPRDSALREARRCYDHLAGARGVQMYEALRERGDVLCDGDEMALSEQGAAFVMGFGVDLSALGQSRTRLCRPCLDWSERRTHLAGGLGRALLTRMIDLGWLRRDPAGRALIFSPDGLRQFNQQFRIP